jgi:hypothetical protein
LNCWRRLTEDEGWEKGLLLSEIEGVPEEKRNYKMMKDGGGVT